MAAIGMGDEMRFDKGTINTHVLLEISIKIVQ